MNNIFKKQQKRRTAFNSRITEALLSDEGKDCQKTLMAIYVDKETFENGLSDSLILILSSSFRYDYLGELRNLKDETNIFFFEKKFFLKDDEFKTRLLNSLESANFNPQTMEIGFHSEVVSIHHP